MSRRPLDNRNIRKLGKTDQSYTLTIPIEYIRELGWRQRQKLTVKKEGKRLIIEDWKE